ncbi:hypothetical protein QYE76_049248 [Lolium multiflorum]|uniref:SIAH-type domain-containing protein n=1 Tax=Lolium multiflorum TaxID=4521 RepID=A0AAD8WG62_LOLMU|nr:hypothetical protein QYE76_049248 [Lolium multiflorum]
MAGQEKRLSPPTPAVNGEHGAKKARAQALVPVVKQEPRQGVEREEGEVANADGPAAAAVAMAASTEALVALAPGPPALIDVRFEVALLHCKVCLLPLKPPVFKCESGHVLCCYCRGGHVEVCGRADIHCGGMDAFICAAKVPCSYKGFGCEQYVVYHQAEQHKRACQHAPCLCPELGCGFLGTPPALIDHFAAVHSRPIIAVRYGRPWNLSLPLAQRWHVVVGQENQSVFLVTLGELGAAATAVSLVCVRADGAAAAAGAPQFWCKLSVEHPGGDKDKVVLMASAVGSSTLSSGAPVPGQGMFLAVPQELMSVDTIAISVRIDQVHPVADAAAAAKAIPPPPARTTRRFH